VKPEYPEPDSRSKEPESSKQPSVRWHVMATIKLCAGAALLLISMWFLDQLLVTP